MKAEELMVGDLLIDQDGEKLIFVSVEKFDLDAVRVKRKDGHAYNVAIDFLQPVPIIPVFLEKIGFKQVPNGFLLTLKEGAEEHNYILVQFCEDGYTVKQIEISVANETYVRAKNIKYIHQLQHALNLCNIEKLPFLV